MVQVIAGRYQITDELGKGGMGTVYRGLDTAANQVVAIKELHPQFTSAELIERFKREGEALRELNHPNIVKLLDTVQHDGAYYLVMEYVAGGDLHDLLQSGQLSIERCLRLALDLADALTRAHKLDIIHRDLKPANVLLADDGTLRLSDFGVARFGQKERVTATDMIVGTIDYLAPEALDGAGIDSRADIWAFGVMLFEMLAGQRPFSGDSISSTLVAILTHSVPDLESLRPDAPIALIDLIYRMLEKEREARIRTVRHVGAELEDILSGHSDRTPPQTRFAPPTPDFLYRPKHNLPAQTTPFVGREAELAELAKLLDNPKIRVITIVAQGGMGKTRLALEMVEQYITPTQSLPEASGRSFKDGVYVVELAPLADAANIVSAIAEAVSYQFQADGRDQKQQILDFLGNKNLLLVLDNFEHLLEGANLVTDMLKAAPNVKILATSRQRLNQSGETLFNLEGMDFPAWETPEDALEYAAVKLFMQSAKRAKPDFEITADNMDAIARICKLVQGLPLGIVLAAAWLPMLSPDEIAAEISNSIDFLATDMGDIPARQQSIRAVFDYSWDLLMDDEKQVFMKLSVFRGGFTREAAEAVVGANLRVLMNLMNKSLIRRDADSGRYQIHELLRQYGELQLEETGDMVRVGENHARYFAKFIAPLGQVSWQNVNQELLEQVNTDFDNVRTAWNFQLARKNIAGLQQFLDGLWTFLEQYQRTQEAITLFEIALLAFQPVVDDATLLWQGQLLVHVGWFYGGPAQDKSQAAIEQGLQILQAFELDAATHMLLAYVGYVNVLWRKNKLQECYETNKKGLDLAYKIDDTRWRTILENYLATSYAIIGRHEEALAWIESLPEAKRLPGQMGMTLMFLGKHAEAEAYLRQDNNRFHRYHYVYVMNYNYLVNITVLTRNFDRAWDYVRQALHYIGDTFNGWMALEIFGYALPLFIAEQQYRRSVEILALILHHPATAERIRGNAQEHESKLKSELSADEFDAAWERGKTLKWEEVVRELMVESEGKA